MQDVIQMSLDDAEVAELFEGVSAGSKIKITLDVTVSEIDDERLHATVDLVHDDIDVIGEEVDEDFEEEEVEEEEEVDEEDEEEEEE